MAIYNNETDPNILMWEKLENERVTTMSDPKFQQWMQELNVSQSYEDPTLKHNALDLMNQYDSKQYSKLNFKLN
jgi:hypothetical protein